MNMNNRILKLVLTALMMALVMTLTMFIKIPTANGYVHFGDAMIFLSVLILGWKRGAVAASSGAAMADVLSGYAMWAPWTFVSRA